MTALLELLSVGATCTTAGVSGGALDTVVALVAIDVSGDPFDTVATLAASFPVGAGAETVPVDAAAASSPVRCIFTTQGRCRFVVEECSHGPETQNRVRYTMRNHQCTTDTPPCIMPLAMCEMAPGSMHMISIRL